MTCSGESFWYKKSRCLKISLFSGVRFNALLLYFGTSPRVVTETSVQGFARMISEFALEYRTSKERVESQKKKKHNEGKRKRTRGKMITEVTGLLAF